jgi:hypothetical protein
MTSQQKSQRIAELELENANLKKELEAAKKSSGDAWARQYAREQEIDFLREVVRASVGAPPKVTA